MLLATCTSLQIQGWKHVYSLHSVGQSLVSWVQWSLVNMPSVLWTGGWHGSLWSTSLHHDPAQLVVEQSLMSHTTQYFWLLLKWWRSRSFNSLWWLLGVTRVSCSAVAQWTQLRIEIRLAVYVRFFEDSRHLTVKLKVLLIFAERDDSEWRRCDNDDTTASNWVTDSVQSWDRLHQWCLVRLCSSSLPVESSDSAPSEHGRPAALAEVAVFLLPSSSPPSISPPAQSVLLELPAPARPITTNQATNSCRYINKHWNVSQLHIIHEPRAATALCYVFHNITVLCSF